MQEGDSSKTFLGIRFALLGFDPTEQAKVRSKLISGGGVDVGEFSPKCTHLIVDKIVYDDPKCVIARNDGKVVVTALWVDHSLDVGSPIDISSVLYTPVKDLNGIPGAKSFVICLTGYLKQDRDDIMKMVGLMGGQFSKPLIANKVTHLICYKFEGEKYELAKKMRKIKLVNHRWLEDCLKAWEIVPESNYIKSGYELETMEAEAKDSEEETEEDTNAKQFVVGEPSNLPFRQFVAGEPSNCPSGSGTMIPKGSEIPVLDGEVHQNSAACKKDMDGKSSLTSTVNDAQPSKVAELHCTGREGREEMAYQSFGAYSANAINSPPFVHHERSPNLSKDSTGLAPNLRIAERTPLFDAAKSSPQNDSKQTPRRSSDLKSSGMLSTHLQGSPHGDLEQYKAKDDIDTLGSRLEQPNVELSSGENHSSRKDPELHLKEGTGPLPQKRKSSLSFASSKSATKVIGDVKPCPAGSASVAARAETLMNETPYKKSSPLNDDNPFYQIGFWDTIGNQSADLPKTKSSGSSKFLKHGLSNPSECPSDVRMLDTAAVTTPETCRVDLKESNVPTELNAQNDENIPEVQDGKMVEPQEVLSTANVSPPRLGNFDMSGIHVNSSGHIQTKSEASSKLPRRKTLAKKSLGSRSKPSGGGANKQKGSLSFDRTAIPNEAMLGSGDGQEEAVHGEIFGVKPANSFPTAKNMDFQEKSTGILCTENKVDNNAASVDDETEAPEEETLAEIERPTSKEMAEQRTNKDLDLANAFEDADNQAVILQEDRMKVAVKVGASIVNEGKTKLRKHTSNKSKNSVSIKKDVEKPEEHNGVELVKKNDVEKMEVAKGKKNATSLMKHIDKLEKNNDGVELAKKTDEKMESTKTKAVHRSANKVKTRTVSVDKTESATVSVEIENKTSKKMEVEKETMVQCPTNKLKTINASVDKIEKPVDAEKDDKPTEGRDTIKGRKNSLSKRKKFSVPALKETKSSGNDRVVGNPEGETTAETIEVDTAKKVQHPANKLKSKALTVDGTNEPKDAVEDKEIENGGPAKGRKRLPTKSKKEKDCKSVKESETVGQDKDGVAFGGKPSDEKIDLGAEKIYKARVQNDETKLKSKTVSEKKAQKSMDAEKENKPIESEGLGATLGKRLRAIAAARTNKKAVQNKNTDNVNKGDQDKASPREGSALAFSEPVWFILSGHRLQRKEFQQVIKRLRGRVCRDSHNWSYQATHFIVPEPVRRTEKFFAAAASGRWILKSDYLAACNQAGTFLAEEPYEWFKSGLSEDGAINLEAPRKWRLLRERTGHGAFYGMRIVVYGECIAPPLDTLKRAVKAGDGTILATSPPYTRFLQSGIDFAVVGPGTLQVDSWVQEFLRHEIPCVVADYLVEYVCKPGYSLDRHVLFKTHAWAEKSVAKLLSRSEEIVEISEADEVSTPSDHGNSADIPCQICGSHDRAEVMLICGDETGSKGCGIGTHIDCCDPPLEAVPEEDWFCTKCSAGRTNSKPSKGTKRKSSSCKSSSAKRK